eukprot:scaffold1868_cov193-Cylindrotheca_fusiformis.AAC.4
MKFHSSIAMVLSSSQQSKVLIKAILWIGLFPDVLESFAPIFAPGLSSSKLFSTVDASTATLDVVDSHTTITLPPFTKSSDDAYPSSLHRIHVKPLLSIEEANKCCQLSNEFAASTGRWDSPDSERHASYATCDFPVEDCEKLEKYLDEIGFDDRLFSELSDLYAIERGALSYLDLFVAHYQVKEDGESNVMDRLELHRDGTLLSFSLLLNSPDDFSGGGTFYDALRDVEPAGILHSGGVIRPNQGNAVLHCGKVLHGADVVTAGYRTVLVGFVDVADYCTREGVLARACTDFGRMDVAARRYKRQLRKNNRGWNMRNDKFLKGHSGLKRFAPAFESVVRRGESEYQRKIKLEAEDTLLRAILLPDEDRVTSPYNDITIL